MRRLLLAAPLLALAGHAAAATFFATSVEEMARTSDAVVRGRVLDAASRFTRDGRIVTEVEVLVEGAWKGGPEATVRLVVPGGRVGSIAQTVDAAPRFEEGEEVVVFLSRRGPSYRVNGHALGKYRVAGAEARSALGAARVLPRALREGERQVETMGVAELEARVRAAR